MSETQKILAPIDFSEPSIEAAKQAAELASKLGAELCLLHVCPVLLYALGPDAMPEDPNFEHKLKASLKEKLEQQAAQLEREGLTITTAMHDGNPSLEIAAYAKQHGFNLIVMATHGRSGLRRLALGSVAERTVRLSEVPVLTLRVGEADGA
ncbi:MAG: universal stress protein [Myxococcales bacterium]|nr:universal stress protein [Myxococcales bacterium]